MGRKCSICHQEGHYSSTCPIKKDAVDIALEVSEHKLKSFNDKFPAREKKKKQRKCSICNTFGHNARGCPNKNKPIEETLNIDTVSISSAARKRKEKQLGRQILEEQNKKVERVEVDGQIPKRGLWLVNTEKQKVAGKISKVKRDGTVLWKDCLGAIIPTNQNTLIEQGYSYIEELEVEMLSWKIVGR